MPCAALAHINKQIVALVFLLRKTEEPGHEIVFVGIFWRLRMLVTVSQLEVLELVYDFVSRIILLLFSEHGIQSCVLNDCHISNFMIICVQATRVRLNMRYKRSPFNQCKHSGGKVSKGDESLYYQKKTRHYIYQYDG